MPKLSNHLLPMPPTQRSTDINSESVDSKPAEPAEPAEAGLRWWMSSQEAQLGPDGTDLLGHLAVRQKHELLENFKRNLKESEANLSNLANLVNQ